MFIYQSKYDDKLLLFCKLPYPWVLEGSAYKGPEEEHEEEEEDEVVEEETIMEGGGGGGGGGGGVAGGGTDGSSVIDMAPEETKAAWVEAMMLVAASLYLYFSISPLIALSSACNDCTCCCKAEIAPMHPYTGSLSLKFASYTRLFAVSALWLSGTS